MNQQTTVSDLWRQLGAAPTSAASWLADEQAAYVAAAVALAAQVARLRGQRAELCAQMAASPLCDITTYVADFEALLQRMWAFIARATSRQRSAQGRTLRLMAVRRRQQRGRVGFVHQSKPFALQLKSLARNTSS